MSEILKLVEGLWDKDNQYAYNCLRKLEAECKQTNKTYQYFDRFIPMLKEKNSYLRTRGLILISANAKWDNENKIEKIIAEYLSHITDDKPTTARQCIKSLPNIAKYQPHLSDCICKTLLCADFSKYEESMSSLLCRDIETALKQIKNLK